ncbi:MAG: PDZ domain-containing protein [Sedimentisphaerales bacterium]|nr:PDZ domain-containing protein [Sedimentisphaerales bacterium]
MNFKIKNQQKTLKHQLFTLLIHFASRHNSLLLFFAVISISLICRTSLLPAHLIAGDQPDSLRFLSPSCQNAAAEKRYLDGSLRDYIFTLNTTQSQNLLQQIDDHITRKFYQPRPRKILIRHALEQMLTTIQNKKVQKTFNTHYLRILPLKNQLKKTLQQFTAAPDSNLPELTDLVQQLSIPAQNAGFGSAWPALELACALVDNLDDYSYVLTPNQRNDLYQKLDGAYVGIGVDLIFEEHYPLVYDVIPHSPAQKIGILPGDHIITVAGIDIRDQSETELAQIITGPENSSIDLTLRRDNKNFNCQLRRQRLESPSVRQIKILPHSDTVGYLKIASFDRDTAMELLRAVDKLKNLGAQQLIIDLRKNGGGMVTSAVDAARLFLEQGRILTVQSAQQNRQYSVSPGDLPPCSLPVSLLVDRDTASAAEIFAAALKDHQRALLIGEKTVGKGVIQTIFPLDNTSIALCLTTSSYLPPSNISFNQIGIAPDIQITRDQLTAPGSCPPAACQFTKIR